MINNRGFTLIEFLVAMVILMIGLLGMLQGINLAIEKSMDNVFRNEGVMVADSLMMAKRSKAFASLSTTATSPAWTTLPGGPRFTRGVYKNYSVQQIVNLGCNTVLYPSCTSNTKEVIINVSWNYKKQKKTHSISSLVSTSSTP